MAQLVEQTISEFLEQRVAQVPHNEALVYTNQNGRMTYQQFNTYVNDVAKALMATGLNKGEHFSVWTTNVAQWPGLQFGSGKMGAPLVTINTNYRANELEYILKQSDSRLLVLIDQFRDHAFIETLYQICPELRHSAPGNLESEALPLLKTVVVIGESTYPGTYSWEELAAWIIPKNGHMITEANIRAFCDSQISRHKIPRYIFFVAGLYCQNKKVFVMKLVSNKVASSHHFMTR